MNLGNSLCFLVMISCVLFCSEAEAHSAFKKRLQAQYPNKKISCNTCHVDKKPKSERNLYGQLFHKTFENKTLSADLKSKRGPEKKAFEAEVLSVEFDKAFEKVKAMTFHDLVEAGVIDGITEKEEKEEK